MQERLNKPLGLGNGLHKISKTNIQQNKKLINQTDRRRWVGWIKWVTFMQVIGNFASGCSSFDDMITVCDDICETSTLLCLAVKLFYNSH